MIRRVKIDVDYPPIKTKIEVVRCYMCSGDGYTVDEENRPDTDYTSNSCNFYHGCQTCGGSGRRAYSGWSTPEERAETMVKGSGLIEDHFTWNYESKSWQKTRWSRDLPYPKPFIRKSATGVFTDIVGGLIILILFAWYVVYMFKANWR